VTREQLLAQITNQEHAIAGVQARLKSGEFSRAGRAKLEREMLKRAQLRYSALHDFRKLGKYSLEPYLRAGVPQIH
jgi:hypothetical protein